MCGLPAHRLCPARTSQRTGGPRVSTTVDQAGERGLAERLGIEPGMVVQERGWDEDTDDELRGAIEDRSGSEMMDALHPLADNGVIWLLTPKSGREGHVPPSDISEAAPTAGLSQTSSISAARDWSGARLVTPKARGSKR